MTVGDKLDTHGGPAAYAAPEIHLGKEYQGPEIDVRSLGVVLYNLVRGTLLFKGRNLKQMRNGMCVGSYRIPFHLSRL